MEVQGICCVNHPKTETRVRCSNCGDPICVKCMVNSAVGQKCRKCARIEYRAGAGGGRRYLAAGAGLLTAAVLQVALMLSPLGGMLSFLLPLVVGYATGSVVKKVGGWGLGSAAAIATGCGVAIGLLFVGVPLGAAFRFLFRIAIASYVAYYRASH